MISGEIPNRDKNQEFLIATGLSLFGALAFYFSTRPIQEHFDYTARIAAALLHGHLGLETHPGAWLNEMVPREGKFYSAFPLGAVLSVVPVAFLQDKQWIDGFPGHFLAALIVGLCIFFFFRLSSAESKSIARRLLLALFPVFGTWTWCNLGFAGAWQIALAFAMLGEVVALYFTLVRPRPFVAGAFFALAYGNRTELLLTLPIYAYLLLSERASRNPANVEEAKQWFDKSWRRLIGFLVVPLTLGVLTAAYNFARFHSLFDFGYARIPKLRDEPWYQHGLFSIHAIPWNAYKMLFEGFGDRPTFPYLTLYPFGCSIFLASPFLFLLFREGGKYKGACWIAIAFVTFALWLHGNPGGWQFSYRYAITLLPWMFVLLVSNGPMRLSVIEVSLFIVSVVVNALATYQFLWTNEIHP